VLLTALVEHLTLNFVNFVNIYTIVIVYTCTVVHARIPTLESSESRMST